MEWTWEGGSGHMVLRAVMFNEPWGRRWSGRGVDVVQPKIPASSGLVSVCKRFFLYYFIILLHPDVSLEARTARSVRTAAWTLQ